jgi:hypothetical protein
MENIVQEDLQKGVQQGIETSSKAFLRATHAPWGTLSWRNLSESAQKNSREPLLTSPLEAGCHQLLKMIAFVPLYLFGVTDRKGKMLVRLKDKVPLDAKMGTETNHIRLGDKPVLFRPGGPDFAAG